MSEEKEVVYGADQIQILEGLEAVRKRPGMYIGSTSERGLHHLVYEIVDNAIDEALAGYCDEVQVFINKDNSITVIDNGRGIPVGINHKAGIPAVEVVFTILHAGGKFGGGGYKVSGGLHGVGASVVNALSTWLEVTIYHEGKIYRQRYERGKTIYKLKVIGDCDLEKTGTMVTFHPDPEIFEETVFDYDVLKQRFREMAFLTRGLKIVLRDERQEELIKRFKNKPSKAAFARSRKKILERMHPVEKPREDMAHIFTGTITPLVSGSKWVFEAEHLKIGYDKHPLLELSLRIRKGQKIGLLGVNGSGKTTFLKTVAGFLPAVAGECSLGNNITIGYFDQYSAAIQSEKTVVEHFSDLFPSLTDKEVRTILGAYLFKGKDGAKRVDDLSGGEKARLVLAELLQSRPNFLILDEPTNHMDIQAKETLESAFQAYEGTILFVSHDRYFIRQVARSVLIFENNAAFYYPFGYEHYLERKEKEASGEPLAARIKAEEQALIEGLKAVPRAERHRLREIPQEEAYEQWRLRLAAEATENAAEHAASLYQQILEKNGNREEWELEHWCETADAENKQFWSGDRKEPAEGEMAALTEQYETAQSAWKDACLFWYDIWCESHQEPEPFSTDGPGTSDFKQAEAQD